MNFSISKISLRTRLLTITAFALLALLIAVLSAYRTARTSEFYAERQATANISTVLRELVRGRLDAEKFERNGKMPPHIREAFERYADEKTRSTAIAIHLEPEISAGFCTANGEAQGAIYNQNFNADELPYVQNACRNLSENNLHRYELKDSILLIETTEIDEAKNEIAGAFAVQSIGKSNIFADRFNFLTQSILLVSAIGLAVFSFLTLRDWRGGMEKIEIGLQEIPNNLSKRIDAPPIAELNAISLEINRLAEKLETNSSRQKTLEKDLAHSEKLAALGRMASGAAHEIRNPLAAMKLKIQLAERSQFDAEKMEKTFTVLGEEIERLDNIVKKMLEASRPSHLDLRKISLSGLLDQRLAMIKEKASAQSIEIQFEMSGKNILVEADAEKLTQVFDNLFNNALEAMPGGGILRVETQTENENFIIKISDSGAGIPKTERAKLFELFYTTKDKGTGLGLAISREIVEAHNGRLYFSESETGAMFIVEVPLLT